MARTLTAQGLIQLPSLTAEETVTLATKLITTAESAGALPGNARAGVRDRWASGHGLARRADRAAPAWSP